MSNSRQCGRLHAIDHPSAIRYIDDLPHLLLVLAVYGMELVNNSVQYLAGRMLVLAEILGIAFGMHFAGMEYSDGGAVDMGPCVSRLAAYHLSARIHGSAYQAI